MLLMPSPKNNLYKQIALFTLFNRLHYGKQQFRFLYYDISFEFMISVS